MSYAKFDYGNKDDNDKCQKCNLTERIGLGYGWAKKSCEWCLEDFCNICIANHYVACAKKSTGVVKPPRNSSIIPDFGGKKEIESDPAKNCCRCGYKRGRSGTCWSVYTPPRKCETCDGCLCTFCNVGMIMRGSKRCLNANRLPIATVDTRLYEPLPPIPPVETPIPPVDIPTPVVETPIPPVETPTPTVVETPIPPVETPTPVVVETSWTRKFLSYFY
jgi:hypothetical protein